MDPNEIMTKENFHQLVDALFKEVETRDDAFLEINRELSKVMQVGPYRIVIVYAPLSDGMEMTVVKPVKKMSMEEYQLDPELFDSLRNKAKGILISGAPVVENQPLLEHLLMSTIKIIISSKLLSHQEI